MAIDVGSPSEAHVGDARETSVVPKEPSGSPSRVTLVSLALIQVAWIATLFYATVQAVHFFQGLN